MSILTKTHFFYNKNIRFPLFFLLLIFFSFFQLNLFSYEVLFKGVENQELLTLIESSSQLVKLKDSPPTTLLGLKRRAEGDLTNIIQALHSRAYYGAQADFTIEPDHSIVTVTISPGVIYPFSSFTLHFQKNGEEISEGNFIDLKDLEIKIGEPAFPESILNTEDLIIEKLKLEGFAFASIVKREVFADQKNKTVIVSIVVDTGPPTYFGDVKITGLERVKESFLLKKLNWSKGELYQPFSIEKTQELLELSGLFRSVNITFAEQPTEENLIPMEIAVVEEKQRSIGFGMNYTTSLGPGFVAEWEDRNIFGEGQKLSFYTNIWQKLQEGAITYVIPDFNRKNQNLNWLLEYEHERTKSFTENSLSLSGIIERRIDDHLRVSYGGGYKRLRSQRSDFNGVFDLIKIPLQLRWSNVDNLLEPSKGLTIQLRTIPSIQLFKPQFAYAINTFSSSIYQSLSQDNRHIFAAKLTLGTILGASQHEIPPPERFYAGSESTLRGYRYLTVSPLGHHEKPLGGRSMFIYSLEFRSRIGENLGLVFFYDIGNVYRKALPEFRERMRQSAGVGIRYYTPIGPLRLDIAVPLNKRHIDNSLEAYFSIGQSF